MGYWIKMTDTIAMLTDIQKLIGPNGHARRQSGQPLAERYAQMILQAKWLPRTQLV